MQHTSELVIHWYHRRRLQSSYLELPRKPRLPRIFNYALFVLITRNRLYTEFVIFWGSLGECVVFGENHTRKNHTSVETQVETRF